MRGRNPLHGVERSLYGYGGRLWRSRLWIHYMELKESSTVRQHDILAPRIHYMELKVTNFSSFSSSLSRYTSGIHYMELKGKGCFLPVYVYVYRCVNPLHGVESENIIKPHFNPRCYLESITWSWKISSITASFTNSTLGSNPLHGVESHVAGRCCLRGESGESITWSWKWPWPPRAPPAPRISESITWSWKIYC